MTATGFSGSCRRIYLYLSSAPALDETVPVPGFVREERRRPSELEQFRRELQGLRAEVDLLAWFRPRTCPGGS